MGVSLAFSCGMHYHEATLCCIITRELEARHLLKRSNRAGSVSHLSFFNAGSSSALAGLRMGASSQSFSNRALTPTNLGTFKNVGASQSLQSKLRPRRTLDDDDEEEEYCDSCAEQVWLCVVMLRL